MLRWLGFLILIVSLGLLTANVAEASGPTQDTTSETSSDANFERVVRVAVNDQTYSFTRLPNLMQVYLAAEFEPADYWPVSRLLSDKQRRAVFGQRDALVQQLQELEQWAREQDHKTLANRAAKWSRSVATWPLVGAEWVGHTKIVDRLDQQSGVSYERPSLFSSFSDAVTHLKNNPTLPSGVYSFLPPTTTPEQWHTTLVTAEGFYTVTFDEDDTVRDVLENFGVFSKHKTLTEVELVYLTGYTKRSAVAYYNDEKHMPPVGGVILVGVPQKNLPERWKTIGQQLVELARYWNPQS
ncbi:hypothetical protein ACFOD1_02535 [Pseudidiomarina halophila]|uniref:Capsule biosynthesis GfcC-like C-terminal domain-containing protein n=1 Tax=Pseudidiomarina halophila TaxID=1449799 RepID=A0A432XWM1_9GAMM|nr:hypothetical protein [Pseudidiomarina halophila]RUO53145.1 hypothetical protein CWI69_08990 [Pseudidiomarina halophila]